MYKQNPKSPVLKALKGNQPNLNAGLRAAIEAAPESPAQKKGPTPAEKKRMAHESRIKDFKKGLTSAKKPAPEAPTKQTTAAEFAYEKSLKEKEMGKSTKVVDKLTSALEAPFSDKTYSELKKEKRAKQKAKYNAKK